MDLLLEDLDFAVEFSAPVHPEETLAVSETQVTAKPSDLRQIRDEVTELLNTSLLEYENQLKEILEDMKKNLRADLSTRGQERKNEAQARKDRIRTGSLELDGWLTSWVTKWPSKVKKASKDHGTMYSDMRHDLRRTLGLMEFRNQKAMYMRHMKARDDENKLQRGTEENLEILETAFKDMTAEISKQLDDMWAKFKVHKLHPETSSELSVISATATKSKDELDPLDNPHQDLKRARRLPPIPKKTKKLKKIQLHEKVCVVPAIQEDEYAAERNMQETIKMFQVKTETEERKVEVEGQQKKRQGKWKRIFRWLFPKLH